MKSSKTIACVLLFCVLCGIKPGQIAAQREPALEPKPAASQEMSKAIEQVLKLEIDSYQVFLRESMLLAAPRFKGQEWADAQESMKTNEFEVVKEWANGDTVHSIHLLKKDAIVFPGGASLDLQLHLSAGNLNRGRLPAKPGKLYAARVMLVSDIRKPYEQILEEQPYPNNTVLDVLVRSNEMKRDGETWPIVKEISVHYGYLESWYTAYNPSGFFVTVEYVASTDEEIGGKTWYFHIVSGLDPPRDRNGNAEAEQEGEKEFTPRDMVYKQIMKRGGSEWWRGDSETIEANKRKYLRPAE